MKKIKLTKGKYAIIDDEDFEEVSKYNWYFSANYAFTDNKRHKKFKDIDNRNISMHRFIFDRHKEKKLYIDHIDGNPLNNQKSNLRYATNQQNQGNSKISKNNKSGYKGVSWDKVNKKWTAQIMFNGKHIKIGRFKDKEEAYKIYCKKGKELFLNYFRNK